MVEEMTRSGRNIAISLPLLLVGRKNLCNNCLG
jgi:hypothetical protein